MCADKTSQPAGKTPAQDQNVVALAQKAPPAKRDETIETPAKAKTETQASTPAVVTPTLTKDTQTRARTPQVVASADNTAPKTDAAAPQAKPAAKPVPAVSRVDLTTVAQTSPPRPKHKRRRRLLWSFILCVLLPVIAGTTYYIEFATDRYVASAGFAIRGVNSGGGLDGIGALTGLASAGSTTSDSYIVLKYLKSRDLLERLSEEIDLRTAFSQPQIDPLSRLSPEPSIEEFVRYWQRMTSTSFDATSGIVTLEVQAFTPQDAKRIADLVVDYTDDMVNQLSERAREDSVRFAQAEVVRAEERLLAALQEIRTFRTNEQSIDPAATAQIDIELLGALRSRLVDLRARIASISDQLDTNAPSLIDLRRQESAIEEQIQDRTSVIGSGAAASGSGTNMSDLLVVFETLEVERTFAQETYKSALVSLEQARAEAGRQQRYLAIFSRPSVPQEARYPDRPVSILMLTAIAFCFWGIATLIVLSVRDHLS